MKQKPKVTQLLTAEQILFFLTGKLEMTLDEFFKLEQVKEVIKPVSDLDLL
jgi:hypothetical protein